LKGGLRKGEKVECRGVVKNKKEEGEGFKLNGKTCPPLSGGKGGENCGHKRGGGEHVDNKEGKKNSGPKSKSGHVGLTLLNWSQRGESLVSNGKGSGRAEKGKLQRHYGRGTALTNSCRLGKKKRQMRISGLEESPETNARRRKEKEKNHSKVAKGSRKNGEENSGGGRVRGGGGHRSPLELLFVESCAPSLDLLTKIWKRKRLGG